MKQATKVKNMVVEKALSQAEDLAVVKARELAADARLKEEALERRIRELAHSRSARIPLSGAAINDDHARLLAKELTKMTAALPKVEAGAGADDGAGDGSGACDCVCDWVYVYASDSDHDHADDSAHADDYATTYA